MRDPDLEAWKAADAAFDRLLDLPAGARADALAAAGLSEPVRRRVERLLRADARRDGRMDGPGLLAGRRIGRWVVGAELGRGGMSVVHRAHEADAPERVAALKILTLGALAGPGAERFRREQSILARLRHPHIATLLDAGVEADGTPWLAMALVEGERIDAWCEAQGLDARARVRLLLDVCEAVAHAHRNLVVHRDLKPSNVLVDAEGHVRLLDFGIARLADDTTGEATATHWRALSPAYAAPEQFDGAAPSTAMDVFGLGAVLYALLSGSPPREQLRPGEDIEPVSRAAQRPASLRHRPPAALLRGDLDAILARALALDPQRRYPSVEALGADLRRWLSGEAVQARGAGMVYRMQRLLRRHWPVAAMGAVAAASLVGGTLVALDRAREAEAQAARAAAVQDFVLGVFRADRIDARGDFVVSKREVAEEAARRLAEAERAGQAFDPALSLALARVLADLGLAEEAAARVESARARIGPATTGVPESIDAALQLARLRLDRDRPADAEALLREAVQALDGEPPARTVAARSLLAMALYYQARIDEALAVSDAVQRDLDGATGVPTEPAIDALRDRAVILRATGRLDEAIAAAARARDATVEAYGADSPRLVRSLDLLGTLQRRAGRIVDALASQRMALEIARRSAGSIAAARLSNIARTLLVLGDAAEAEAFARQALERRREELGAGHPGLAETEEVLVLARAELGELAPAEAFYAGLLGTGRAATNDVQDVRRRTTYARVRLQLGDPAGARAIYAEAMSLQGDSFPARAARAAAGVGLGCASAALGDPVAARAALEAAAEAVDIDALELEDRIAHDDCLAAVEDAEGEAARALARRERLDARLAPLLGEDSPRRAALWRKQAALLDRVGRGAEAATLRERAAQVLARTAR